jgi:hypothetical protein
MARMQNGFFCVDFGGVRLRSGVVVQPDTWYHVAATKMFSPWKAQTTALYINGDPATLSVRC